MAAIVTLLQLSINLFDVCEVALVRLVAVPVDRIGTGNPDVRHQARPQNVEVDNEAYRSIKVRFSGAVMYVIRIEEYIVIYAVPYVQFVRCLSCLRKPQLVHRATSEQLAFGEETGGRTNSIGMHKILDTLLGQYISHIRRR